MKALPLERLRIRIIIYNHIYNHILGIQYIYTDSNRK